jgi:hypothetical protein
MATVRDENQYYTLRRKILAILTKSEHARAARIASQMDYNQISSTIDPLVKAKLLERTQKRNSIIIHCTYEKRYAYYKSKIHQLWNAFFNHTKGIDTKIIVGTCNNPNLTNELVRRSPRAEEKKK